MNILSRAIMIASALVVTVAAQQQGDANRDYAIQGRGFGTSSGQQSTVVPTPGTMNNAYRTLDPFAPVVWGRADGLQIGWYTDGVNSLDLQQSSLEILADGTGAGLINQVFRTDARGEFDLAVGVQPTSDGFHQYAMAHYAPSSATGVWISPAVGCRMGGCLGSATPLNLGDDDSLQVSLYVPVNWYGVTYTSIYVNSNGSVTFGAPDITYDETLTGFLGGPPRIAMFWDDLNPTAGGQVSALVSPNAANVPFELCFREVPEYPATGGNTFTLRFYQQPTVGWFFLAWGNMTSQDGLVGLCPGGNLHANAVPIDVTGGTSIGFNDAVYQFFLPGTAGGEMDLWGDDATFVLDGNGFPVQLQAF